MKQGISLFSFSENTDVRWMFEHAKKQAMTAWSRF